MGANIILWIKGNLTAPLNLSLNTPLLLFSFVIIMIVMPYYDDYVDDPIHVDATAANSTKAQPEFSPVPLPGGDVRGLFGGKAPIILIVLLIVGLLQFRF